MAKKYNDALVARVEKLRDGMGPQVLAQLWAVDTGLRTEEKVASKCGRILSGKVYPGDMYLVERMEKAKALLLKVRF